MINKILADNLQIEKEKLVALSTSQRYLGASAKKTFLENGPEVCSFKKTNIAMGGRNEVTPAQPLLAV